MLPAKCFTPDVLICDSKLSARALCERMHDQHKSFAVLLNDPQGDRVAIGCVNDRELVIGILRHNGSLKDLTADFFINQLGQEVKKMLLKDICTMDVVTCVRNTTTAEAAHLMRKHHVGDLVVVDDPHGERTPVGVVTDRDLVVEVLALGLDPATTPVMSYLRMPAVIARDSEDTATALERMHANKVRRMPVVNSREQLVGMITLDDLLKLHATNAAALAQIIEEEQLVERRLRR
jgi:CBS domain-containing protein